MIHSKIFSSSKGQVINKVSCTICEAHRQLYDLLVINLQDRPELLMQLLPLLDVAYSSGVSMNLALVKHKLDRDCARDINWLQGNSTEAKKLRTERIRLVKLSKRLSKIKTRIEKAKR